jgi:hypothetical protein
MNENIMPETSRNLSRRTFGRFTAAAVSGLMLGSSVLALAAAKAEHDPSLLLLGDKHVCRGLNTCKGKGKGGDNGCAGTGQCATAEVHACKGENTCKGQGGCGEFAGQNSCKGQGACNVPLKDKTWKKARKAFEEQASKKGMKVGAAPAPKKKA